MPLTPVEDGILTPRPIEVSAERNRRRVSGSAGCSPPTGHRKILRDNSCLSVALTTTSPLAIRRKTQTWTFPAPRGPPSSGHSFIRYNDAVGRSASSLNGKLGWQAEGQLLGDGSGIAVVRRLTSYRLEPTHFKPFPYRCVNGSSCRNWPFTRDQAAWNLHGPLRSSVRLKTLPGSGRCFVERRLPKYGPIN